MRKLLWTAIMMAMPVDAVIVDRIAVAVGSKVITQSEIEQRIRLTAFQNGSTPDFSLASRRQAAERMIDQRLVEREMDVGHYPRLAAATGQELAADYEKSNFNGDHAAMLAALTKYGLSESDFEEDLARQADLLTFLSLRFRPAVQVSDGDAQKYFDERIPPGAEKDELGLNGFRLQIEEQLTGERADSELEAWLKDQRKRTKIDYAEQDLKETGAK